MKNKIIVSNLGQCILLLFFVFADCVFAFAAQNIKIEIPDTIYTSESSFTLGQVAKISGGNRTTRRILSGLTLYADGDRLTRNEVLNAIGESDASDARIELYMPSYSRIEAPGYEGNFTETSNSRPLQRGDVRRTEGLNDRGDVEKRQRGYSSASELTQNVLYASHNIRQGDKITHGDLMLRPTKVLKPGDYVFNADEIIGYTAKKNIRQGEPILLRNLSNSNIIKHGRQVKIIARIGGARATVDGILLEDGKVGDWVKVRRKDDKKTVLRAKILNENFVEVQVE